MIYQHVLSDPGAEKGVRIDEGDGYQSDGAYTTYQNTGPANGNESRLIREFDSARHGS